MPTLEILAAAAIAAANGLAVVLVARHAIRKVRRAEELARSGWVCVGCNFISGPVMVPPNAIAARSAKTGETR